MRIVKYCGRFLGLLLSTCLIAVLTVAAWAAPSATEVTDYLAGNTDGPLVLTGDVTLNSSITAAGHKAIELQEDATLTLGAGCSLTLPKGSSLALTGQGGAVIDGGHILNQGTLDVGCGLSIRRENAIENRGYGSQGLMRISDGGDVTVANGAGSGILCAATNYNATLSVEWGGRLTLENTGGAALAMTDKTYLSAGFAMATLRIAEGGTVWAANSGGTAIDAATATGSYLSLEAGGQLICAGEAAILSGGTEGIICDESAQVVYLTEQALTLPAGAPEPYYGVRFDVMGYKAEGWSGEYTIHTQLGSTIDWQGETYYPIYKEETPIIASPGYVAADVVITNPVVGGGVYPALLGMSVPEGSGLNTPMLFVGALAAVAAIALFAMQRKEKN